MQHREQWIWLSEERYPDHQRTAFDAFGEKLQKNFVVAEFTKTVVFDAKILRADLRFSGDTAFQLFCNGSIAATGPASVGGDFFGNDRPRTNFYAFETAVYPDSRELTLFARVRMMPVQICDFSRGHGGFMLSAVLTLEDGTRQEIVTDETWLCRKNGAYAGRNAYDGRIGADEYAPAQVVENIWNTQNAPIPVREEREITFENGVITLPPHSEKTEVMVLDRIWAGFVRLQAKGSLVSEALCLELSEKGCPETAVFADGGEYRGFYMHSAGNIRVTAKNTGDAPAELTVSFISTHYPVTEEAHTVTNDPALNQVLDTCAHTLKICRQTHHLDSPKHCEPMACTGDYYVESMMTPFSFGDMRLAEFDLMRTAVMLERENGRMFHTTYSLIWVRMLWDVYTFTGNAALLQSCEKALDILLSRFETYIGANGLIETPPDYMFVDWVFIDGISLHHPPKSLGQTCLNMFCVGALDAAEKIYRILGREDEALRSAAKRTALADAINRELFDAEKGAYFMGLNTPTEEELLGEWMPQNTEKRYWLKHANILAACFGVCDDDLGRELIRKVMAEELEGDVQPYFLHFLFEAVCRLGLREQYTLEIARRWKAPIAECSKGLVEGFYPPDPSYAFDHSHAWGGTPLYAVPRMLLGLEITKPGMEEITLSPLLLGLERVKTEVLTPFGKVTCEMEAGKAPAITAPAEMTVTVK